MELITGFFIFLLGICAGSFFNVCIYRIPRDLSIVSPPSFCPHCQTPIPWYDNFPLASFLILGGKCRSCRGVIPVRYFLIELLSGLVWLGAYLTFGLGIYLAITLIFISLLLLVSVIDLETGFIPDQLTLPGLGLGLLAAAVSPSLFRETQWYFGLMQSAAGALCGFFLLWITACLGSFLFRKEAMGGGDIKLLAMCGAFLGWEKIIVAFFLAAFFAFPFALYLWFVKKSEIIRYGPFLALAAATLFFWGDLVLKYLQL